jgi:hypothetical protein
MLKNCSEDAMKAQEVKKFMRTYSLGDRQLRDFTSHNIYDLRNDFKPEEAKEIQIN